MIEDLKHIIYNMVIEANTKMPTGDVEKAVVRAVGVDRKKVRVAIRDLVRLGELRYTYMYGTSFLERSFDRPVRLSKRIVIKPPQSAYEPRPGEVVINIAAGAAFGDGAHPSTSLAIKALDSALGDNRYIGRKTVLKGLDMGTGSGILAIALARLGCQKVVAVDIDPCAVSEATHNISLNDLNEEITILSTSLERISTCFSVILANMALPTLTKLAPLFSVKMEKNAVLILSGFKEHASKNVRDAYTDQGLILVREELDREWVCLVLRKP